MKLAACLTLTALGLFAASPSLAADWFVRPKTGEQTRRDGSSFGTAWDGFDAIAWDKVKPGDNLYVCDTHIGPGLTIRASGAEGKRIRIRGDWPRHPGAILGASAVLTGGWELADREHNVWKRAFEPPPDYTDWHAFACPAKADPLEGTVRLNNVGKPETCGTGEKADFARWKPSSYFLDGKTLYFRPAEGSANDYLYFAGQHNPCISAVHQHHFDLVKLTLRMGAGAIYDGGVTLKSADHVTMDGLAIRWCNYGIVFGPNWPDRHAPDAASEDVAVTHCTVDHCRCGVYPYGAVKGCRVADNHIHDIGQHGYYLSWREKRKAWHGDIHGIALQGGGDGFIIERNHVHHVGGEGIFPYGDNNPDGVNVQEMRNFVIRYNVVHDIAYLAADLKPHSSTGHLAALYYNQNNVFPSEGMSGNVMASNVIYAAGHGVRMKNNANRETGEATWAVYNNVIADTDVAMCWYSSGNAGGKQPNNRPGVIFKNNIVLNPRTLSVSIATPTIKDYGRVIFDHNIYWPDLAEGFLWPGGKGNFTAWRAWTDGGERDAHSLVADPRFADPAGRDYHLKLDSPAIDAGTPVGLTADLDGRRVPQGKAPDAGAYEAPGK